MAPLRSCRVAAATVAAALYAASRPAAVAAADLSVQKDILHVQLLSLKKGCGSGRCMDQTATALRDAGCESIKGFPTLSMMRARCPPPKGDFSAQKDLSSMPNVVAVVDDFVVETSVPINEVSDLDEAATRQVITGGIRGYWGLDRIDQRSLPLDGSYTYDCFPSAGAGVDVFVLDTGCRSSHQQFAGRASSVFASSPSTGGRGSRTAVDGNGHGTHCAGTVGGVESGVAKAATLRCIKVLSDRGSGSFSEILAGIEEVAAFKAAAPTTRKVVMSMSLGGRARSGQSAEDTAVNRAAELGVIPVVAAGNSAIDACAFTPARAESAITVANGDYNDAVARSSNTGECVDIIAPGTQILSADARSDTGLRFLSGTSMAAPHVSGIVALLLGDRADGASLKSADVKQLLTQGAPNVGGYTLGYVADGCRAQPEPTPGYGRDKAPVTPTPSPSPTPERRSRLPSWWLDLFQ